MNAYRFDFAGEALAALGSGALYWPREATLCVSDLHLGKSARAARRSGALLPPYESADTLARLEADIAAATPRRVICLGDSFDDLAAAVSLPEDHRSWLSRLAEGREWIWIEGNHDAGQVALPGRHLRTLQIGGLCFRHIAAPDAPAGEISGHYHPKVRLSLRGCSVRRSCFLLDRSRLVMPAYGTYTGGLDCTAAPLRALMASDAMAVLTGPTPCAVPMPRQLRSA